MDNDNSKRWFNYAKILAVIVLAYSAWLYASSYGKMVQPGSYRSFAVTADSRVTAKNDIANFTYSVQIQGGKDINQIKKQSDDITAKVLNTLKQQGVDPKDIETVSYNLEPRYQYFNCSGDVSGAPCRPSEIVGYTLSQTDSVKIRDLSKVDSIVSGVVASGVNNVSQLMFTVDDQTTLKTQAKAEAIKKAIAQAKELASAGGFRVGKIISIDENVVYPPMPYADGLGGVTNMKLREQAADSATSINPGSNELTSTVTVRFEIK